MTNKEFISILETVEIACRKKYSDAFKELLWSEVNTLPATRFEAAIRELRKHAINLPPLSVILDSLPQEEKSFESQEPVEGQGVFSDEFRRLYIASPFSNLGRLPTPEELTAGVENVRGEIVKWPAWYAKKYWAWKGKPFPLPELEPVKPVEF